MRVALYLTVLAAPRLYGVDVLRVLEPETLKVSVATTDVLITDTIFDVASVPIKRCCILKGVQGVETFARENGYDCIDTKQIASWFQKRMGVTVTRQARQTGSDESLNTSSNVSTAPTRDVNAQYKAMYTSLAAELCKSSLYTSLDVEDAKTYDLLLQAVRGKLQKADNVVSEMVKVQERLMHVEADLAQLQKEKETESESVDVVLSGLSHAVEDCYVLLDKLIKVTDDSELVVFSAVSVKARAAMGLASKFTSVASTKELRAVGSVMREFISCVVSITESIFSLGSEAVKASYNAQTSSQEAAVSKATSERTVQQIQEKLNQEQQITAGLRQQVDNLTTAYQQQVQRAAEIESQLRVSGGVGVTELQKQLRALQLELQSKQEQIIRMEEAMDVTLDSSQAVLAPEVATGIIRQLRTQVSSLKLERDRATAELLKAKKTATKESERAETLANSAKSLSQVALRGSQVSALPLFNYTAKALIIPVFGNGSTGITSSAVSLAKRLGVNSRTVLVDFDLVTTDLEGRFGERINPLVKIDGEECTGKHSAMGLFIEKGKDYFASHYTELVSRIDSNKAGILDYLPGFYAKPDLFMLTQADYSTLLNYLGARYEYIIIDAGKIGCSEIGDQILRNLCMCCFRSLIVTDASLEKVRAMRLKLNDVFGTELRKVAEHSVWLTNRALKREDLTKFTAPAMSVTLPILSEMLGIHESFNVTGGAQREFNKVVRALAGV